MLLRSSISNTKNFLERTLQNLKACFSPGYKKLPKNHHFSSSVASASVNDPTYEHLENFYSDFTQQWDSDKEKRRRRSKKKCVLSCSAKLKEEVSDASFISLNHARPEQKKNKMEKIEESDNKKNKRSLTHQRVKQQDSSLNSKGVRGNRNCMMEKKMREMEMLDMNDVDYILDIEEVLHYYSRLTCPLYLEIVDKFFMEMYSEFFGALTTPRTRSVNARLKMRS